MHTKSYIIPKDMSQVFGQLGGTTSLQFTVATNFRLYIFHRLSALHV